MAVVTHITEQEYRGLALIEEDRFWELWDGVPVEKPQMSMRHNRVAAYLGAALINQLAPKDYVVSINGDRARLAFRSCFILDVMVIPAAYQNQPDVDPWGLGAYTEPLPLVVEIWSPSTGHYDVTTNCAAIASAGTTRSGTSTRASAPSPRGASNRMAATRKQSIAAASCRWFPSLG